MSEYICEEWPTDKRILMIIFCLACIYLFYGFGEYLLAIIGTICICIATICYVLEWYFYKVNKQEKGE